MDRFSSQGAWDSYIQGTGNAGMDAAQMWPMNLDLSLEGNAPPPPTTSNGSSHGAVFMGATPGTPMQWVGSHPGDEN